MIRSNLATRPFYNERAVRLGLMTIAVLVALATVVNVAQMLRPGGLFLTNTPVPPTSASPSR